MQIALFNSEANTSAKETPILSNSIEIEVHTRRPHTSKSFARNAYTGFKSKISQNLQAKAETAASLQHADLKEILTTSKNFTYRQSREDAKSQLAIDSHKHENCLKGKEK